MKVTTVKREVLVVEDKQIEYANGVIANYTLTNGVLKSHQLTSNNMNLNYTFADKSLIKRNTFATLNKIATGIQYQTEQEMFDINDDTFNNMYAYNMTGGLLYDINGNHVPLAQQLDGLYIYTHIKNTYENMNLLNNFIKTLDFIEIIVDGNIEETYDQDDEIDYTQYDITRLTVYISDVDLYKKYVGKSKFFQRDNLIRDIGNLFLAKYPHLENHED